MELHPILERGGQVKPGLWYVLSACGDCPTERVGHTCSYVPGPSGYGGKVYVVGGATPSGTLPETYVLDLLMIPVYGDDMNTRRSSLPVTLVSCMCLLEPTRAATTMISRHWI